MRLIDADALKASFPKAQSDIFQNCRRCTCMDNEGIDTVIDSAPTVSGWVSVKDRMPEPDKDVLLNVYCNWFGDYYQVIAWRTKKGDWDSNDDGFNQSDDEITHWMPLPEPPKEDDA